MWAVAGARDALQAGRTEEALARLDLLLVAGEQVAIDRGSWVLAQELLLEDDPPFHAFTDSRQGDTTRAAVSRLCDPRWAEVAMTRLQDIDAWNARRAAIQAKAPPGQRAPPGQQQKGGGQGSDAAATATPKGPPYRRPRGKGGQGGGGQPQHPVNPT